jgi:protein O-GlcNAc transferase
MNNSNAIQSAFEYHLEGNLEQAEYLYKNILKEQPANSDILHMLGVLFCQRADYDLAIKYIRKALQLKPANAEAYCNLGVAHQERGELDEAIVHYQKAIEFNPSFVKAYSNLGNALMEKGLLDEAIVHYQKAIELNPSFVKAYSNLGNALREKGQIDEAISYCKKAIDIDPSFAEAYCNMGVALREKGQLDKAIVHYQKAIEFNPSFVKAYSNLGNALQEKGLLDEAIVHYQKALHLNPNLSEVYCVIGDIFLKRGQSEDAINSYQKALHLNPSLINAYVHLGYQLFEQGQVFKAREAYDAALSYDSTSVKARFALCMLNLLMFYPNQWSIEISRKNYHDELIKLRTEIKLKTSRDFETAAEGVGFYPFYLAYQGLNDRNLQQLYGSLICKIMALRYPHYAKRPIMPAYLSGELLRVGVVSGYFIHSSIWKMPIKGWIENLDKKRIRLYGYNTGKKKDFVTETAKNCFYRFVEGIYSFEDLCKIIIDDKLHVLIFSEIGQDPMTLRLASLWLSPIQCASAMGYPETSGLTTIDYSLSSDLMEPSDAEDHYTEKLIRLPNLGVYYTPLDFPIADINRETFGIRQDSVLYLCCQSLSKYLPQYDDIYPRIAKYVGDCQFLFISSTKSWITEQFRKRIHETFDKYALKADDYLVFLPQLDSKQYNAINCLADIFLDSIGWSGCNTTFEAIAYNLPIVTLPGELMRGRHSSAILTMMGMTETIAKTLDEYIELATKLGQDSEWRKYISEKIAEHKHLIYRDMSCVNALEDFIENVVKEKLN